MYMYQHTCSNHKAIANPFSACACSTQKYRSSLLNLWIYGALMIDFLSLPTSKVRTELK